MNTEDFDALVSRLLEEECPTSEVERLRSACREDPSLTRRLADHVASHRLMGPILERECYGDRFAAEVIERLRHAPTTEDADEVLPLVLRVERTLRVQHRWTLARKLMAAAAIVALLGLVAVLLRPRPQLASVVRTEAAVWSGSGGILPVGRGLRAGDGITLEAGFAEIHYANGVRVLVEGPARFVVTAPNRGRIERGRVVAQVMEPRGRGFTIDGPCGRVVDLGTEFGVSVDDSGSMEVHVVKGEVLAEPKATLPVALRANEGLRLSGSSANRIPGDVSTFITDLPPRRTSAVKFIHWSFDEAEGPLCANSGHGLAKDVADATLRTEPPGLPSAQRVEGRFGKALSFDGVDDFAESGYKGISGPAPRTVAMWVRVPRDLKAEESFAMIGWGRTGTPGAAWQVSVNPEPDEGPMGCLRAGAGNGAVVGTTDLRDGKWHHVGVVLYGGPNPDISTHVLLYVDGRLENTVRKTALSINTRTAKTPHNLWIGRNIATARPVPNTGKCFRGEIDEMYLFSGALDQEEIRTLMTENVAPSAPEPQAR